MTAVAPAAVSGTGSTPAAPPAGPAQDLERERTLLDTARSALARGDARGSMALLARHAETFPKGQFAEEAAALRISALLSLGAVHRGPFAGALAFRAKYPKSLLLPALAPALAPDSDHQ